jgi:hypothetical protein
MRTRETLGAVAERRSEQRHAATTRAPARRAG